jgi:hypothetical protein
LEFSGSYNLPLCEHKEQRVTQTSDLSSQSNQSQILAVPTAPHLRRGGNINPSRWEPKLNKDKKEED